MNIPQKYKRLAVIAKLSAVFLLTGLVIGFLAKYLCTPCFFVVMPKEVRVYPAKPGMKWHLRFIHSVQRTPVEEWLVVDEKCEGFVLKSTRYQSFGVGLPFLPEEGTLRQEGEYFIMDGMGRHYQSLSLRPGLGTELTLWIAGEEIKIYELLPMGSRVDLHIAPRYRKFGM